MNLFPEAPVEPLRVCRHCKTAKPLSEMYRYSPWRPPSSFCSDCFRARARGYYRRRPDVLLVVRYKNYRHGDRKRGLLSTLPRDEAFAIMRQPCFWCGEAKLLRGLDRKDNALGHSSGNVVSSCEACNQIRGDIPFAAALELRPGLTRIRELGLLDNWEPPYKKAMFRGRPRVGHEGQRLPPGSLIGDPIDPITGRPLWP